MFPAKIDCEVTEQIHRLLAGSANRFTFSLLPTIPGPAVKDNQNRVKLNRLATEQRTAGPNLDLRD
jgi:hypothetical protein